MSPKVNERRLSHSPISEVFEISSWLDLNYLILIRLALDHVANVKLLDDRE
jgi:hypothetical protein